MEGWGAFLAAGPRPVSWCVEAGPLDLDLTSARLPRLLFWGHVFAGASCKPGGCIGVCGECDAMARGRPAAERLCLSASFSVLSFFLFLCVCVSLSVSLCLSLSLFLFSTHPLSPLSSLSLSPLPSPLLSLSFPRLLPLLPLSLYPASPPLSHIPLSPHLIPWQTGLKSRAGRVVALDTEFVSGALYRPHLQLLQIKARGEDPVALDCMVAPRDAVAVRTGAG